MRTLYACLAENEGELSFEPNQIIINGESSLEDALILAWELLSLIVSRDGNLII